MSLTGIGSVSGPWTREAVPRESINSLCMAGYLVSGKLDSRQRGPMPAMAGVWGLLL